MPVISGYLAFIGFFCFEAGLSLCTSKPLATAVDWLALVQDPKAQVLCLPGIAAGLLLCLVTSEALRALHSRERVRQVLGGTRRRLNVFAQPFAFPICVGLPLQTALFPPPF